MLKHSLPFAQGRRDLHQAKWFFYIFIASLGMFFAASLITYLNIRSLSFRPLDVAVPGSPMALGADFYQSLEIPRSFWFSTLILVANSWLLQRAVTHVHRERQILFRRFLLLSWWTAVAFLVAQCWGMSHLWQQHFSQSDGSTKVFGMSFVLALIHALHVLGGMIFLGFVMAQAFRGRYDHERHWPVDNCAGYWHFLGIVWMIMLATFYWSA